MEVDEPIGAANSQSNETFWEESSSLPTRIQEIINEEVGLISDRKGIVILEPGSLNTRFGFAEQEDRKPATVISCIAYRKKRHIDESSLDQQVSSKNDSQTEKQTSGNLSFNQALTDLEYHYDGLIKHLQKLDKESSVRYLNEGNCKQVLDGANAQQAEWVSIESEPSYIVGDPVMYLDDDDGYDLFFPLQNGRYNYDHVHMWNSGLQIDPNTGNVVQISKMQVLDALEKIWSYIVKERLGIEQKEEIVKYDVLLVIPDQFSPAEVQDMIDILLFKIGFGHILVHKSSCVASLGGGRNTCCVVDIGFSETRISCVEDLEILPHSCFKIPIGGLDISLFMYNYLKASSSSSSTHLHSFLKYDQAKLLSSLQDLLIFEEMKISTCHLIPDLVTPKLYEFLVHHRNQPSTLYRVNVGMSQFFSPMVIAIPQLDADRHQKFNQIEKRKSNRIKSIGYDDSKDHECFRFVPSDPFSSEFWKNRIGLDKLPSITDAVTPPTIANVDNHDGSGTTVSKVEMDTNDIPTTSSASNTAVEMNGNGHQTSDSNNINTTLDSESVANSIPHAIVASILCASPLPRVRNRLFSRILLTGGSSQIEGLGEFIQNETFGVIPNQSMNVVSPPQGVSSENCAWAGALLLVLHTPRSMWLDRVAWKNHGLLALREISMFDWDNPSNK